MTDVARNSPEPGLSKNESGAMHVEEAAPEWTREEERKLVRKSVLIRLERQGNARADLETTRLDLVIMPLLIFGFFVLQLDRSNV